MCPRSNPSKFLHLQLIPDILMSIQDHSNALEEAFFLRKNQQLLEQMRVDLDATQQRAELKSATGISDDDVLDGILSLGVTVESLAAIALVPMVLVAWSDGTISEKEREAIVAAAKRSGVAEQSAAGQLLANWLCDKPDANLEATWRNYVLAVTQQMAAGDRIKFGEQILARCKQVAEAAGGFLGLGSISTHEQDTLKMLGQVFDQGS